MMSKAGFILRPTTLTTEFGNNSSLDAHWTRQLLESGFLQDSDFFESVEVHVYRGRVQRPVWFQWLANNRSVEASNLFVEIAQRHNFSWCTEKIEDELVLKKVLQHLSVESLEKILRELSDADRDTLLNDPERRVGILETCNNQRFDLIDVFMKYGCSLEDPNSNGETLLLQVKTWSAAEALLKRGANPLAVSNDQKTIFDRVKTYHHVKLSEIKSTLMGFVKNAQLKEDSVANTELQTKEEIKENKIKKSIQKTIEEMALSLNNGSIAGVSAALKMLRTRKNEGFEVVLEDFSGRNLLSLATQNMNKLDFCGHVGHARINSINKLVSILFDSENIELFNAHEKTSFYDWTHYDHFMMSVALIKSRYSIAYGLSAKETDRFKQWHDTFLEKNKENIYQWIKEYSFAEEKKDKDNNAYNRNRLEDWFLNLNDQWEFEKLLKETLHSTSEESYKFFLYKSLKEWNKTTNKPSILSVDFKKFNVLKKFLQNNPQDKEHAFNQLVSHAFFYHLLNRQGYTFEKMSFYGDYNNDFKTYFKQCIEDPTLLSDTVKNIFFQLNEAGEAIEERCSLDVSSFLQKLVLENALKDINVVETAKKRKM